MKFFVLTTFTLEKKNISKLLDNKNFELIRHDICFPLYLEVDEIFNLACPASPIHYQFDPVQTTKTSVHGSINVLGLAKRLNAKYFKLQQVRFMEIQMFILRLKITGEMLTL